MDAQETLKKFRENIRAELDLCHYGHTPYICNNIKTPAGYAAIEKAITDKVFSEQITISQAIIEVETDLNPNSYAN